MKKVAILTLNGNYNCGNKLQNYALLHTIKKMGLKVYTIWKYSGDYLFPIKSWLKAIVPLKRLKRFCSFQKFTNKYLNVKYYKLSDEIKDNFDYFIVGSDQVWNYTFKSFSSDYFLPFSSREKNISYAASIGVDEVIDVYQHLFREGLNNFKAISVRENSAQQIVKELTEREDVQVVLDPTMLLDKEEWRKIAKKPKLLHNTKYILTYFLGNLSSERKKEIERVAKENDCEIINLLNKNDQFYNCGPREFLFLEQNAFLICTDSFHSSVFAILFDRSFLVFDREDEKANMSSRLDTLLSKFKLEDRKYNGKITEEDLKHDYTEVYKILEEERKKSLDFLKNALGVEEDE